jgi:hypothetical protein
MDGLKAKRFAVRGAPVLALLSLTVVGPFASWLREGALLGSRDTARLYEPLRSLVVDGIRSFSLPLWNPYEGTGHPLFAEGIHGVLHPVSVAAAWLAPSSMNFLLLAYLVVAALGSWFLARELGRSMAAAFLAATAYALSGFVVSMTDNLVYLAGAATLPWVVAALRACARPGRGPIVGGAAAMAAALFAGDAQSTVVGVLLGAALAVEAGGIRSLGRVAGGVALGALLGAVQFLPAAVHLQRTDRKLDLGAETLSVWALSPWRLVEFLVPGFFGSRMPSLDSPLYRALGRSASYTIPFAKSVHLGLVAGLLALRGVRADRAGRLLGIGGLVLLWLALGPALGATPALGWLPVWGKFRFAEKLVGPLSLCVALLASGGLDRELTAARRSWVPPAALGLLVVGALALWWGAPLEAALAWAGHGDVAPVALASLRSGFWLAAPFNALAAAALAFPRLAPAPRGWLVAGVTWGLATASLPWAVHPMPTGCAGPGWLAGLSAAEPGPRIATPTAREMHPSRPDSWNRTWCEFSALGIPAMNTPARVDQIDLYTGLDPIRFLRVWQGLGQDRWRFLRRYGITHVVAAAPADSNDVQVLERAAGGGIQVVGTTSGGITTWAVPHRPWASFAPSASSAATPQPTLERLQELVARGSDEVVVQADATPPTAPGAVLSVRRGTDRLEVDAEASGPALLVVNDAWWPGWRARVDGSDVPLLPADVLVRAVPFPAGRHRLEMTYEPPEVATGIWLSGLGLAVAAALVALPRRGAQK